MPLAAKVRYAPMICGFCSTGHHNLCPGAVRNGNGSLIMCYCDQPYCGSQTVRCLDCKNDREGEVGPNWRCIDRDACQDEQRRRLDHNPHVRMVREVMIRVAETQVTEKTEKAEKAPKAKTYCVHGCGGETKGGKFLPGHDARYVAELVRKILAEDDDLTEDKALETMGSQGLTEALQQKLSKSVGLARAEAAKKIAAKEEADAKAAAKAQADAAAKAAKAQVADQPATDDSDEAKPATDAPKPAAKKATQKA